MLKKTFLIALKIIGLLLFLSLMILLGPTDLLLNQYSLLYYPAILVSPIFIMPLLFSKYKGSKVRKCLTHFGAVIGTIMFFDVSTIVTSILLFVKNYKWELFELSWGLVVGLFGLGFNRKVIQRNVFE